MPYDIKEDYLNPTYRVIQRMRRGMAPSPPPLDPSYSGSYREMSREDEWRHRTERTERTASEEAKFRLTTAQKAADEAVRAAKRAQRASIGAVVCAVLNAVIQTYLIYRRHYP